jgi:hypothetical protein
MKKNADGTDMRFVYSQDGEAIVLKAAMESETSFR